MITTNFKKLNQNVIKEEVQTFGFAIKCKHVDLGFVQVLKTFGTLENALKTLDEMEDDFDSMYEYYVEAL